LHLTLFPAYKQRMKPDSDFPSLNSHRAAGEPMSRIQTKSFLASTGFHLLLLLLILLIGPAFH
jgi:hypothetical protein